MTELASHPLFLAAGWALVHSLWQGALLALLAVGVLHLSRNQVPEVRYALASGALALLVTAFLGTWIWLSTARIPLSAAGSLAATPVGEGNGVGSWMMQIRLGLSPWIPRVCLAWFFGLGLRAIHLGRALTWLYGPCLRSFQPAPDPWPVRFSAMARRCGVAGQVRLGMSDRVNSLVVLGWLKPVVLVPAAAFLALSPEALEALLIHELAHVRRRDFLANLIQSLADALLFYHPAVWWLSRRIRLEREHCCDDAAVQACGDPILYASALAGLEELRHPSNLIHDLAPAASGGKLMSRIQRILRVQVFHRPFAPPFAILPALLLVAAFGLTSLMASGAARSAPEEAKPVAMDFSKVKVKHQPDPPAYPPEAKAQRIQGTVVVLVVIGSDGKVTDAKAIAGPPELQACAADYARAWTFHPVRVKGKPVPAEFKLTMPFRLR